MPRLGVTFEVNSNPIKLTEDYTTYSLSSSKDKQISFRSMLLVKDYSVGSELIYNGDSVITTGSWMKEHKRGARIC